MAQAKKIKKTKKKKKINTKKIKKIGRKISSLIFETTGKSEDEMVDFAIDTSANILKSKIKQKTKGKKQ